MKVSCVTFITEQEAVSSHTQLGHSWTTAG